jgi:WD40 repeat protein/tRNA A-37 threonylcarbamoyl transferase component Bud32
MNESKVTASSSAAGELVRRIESLWESGQNPDPDELLETGGVSFPADAAKVLSADQWHRWHAGERPALEDYFARHPAVAADPEAALLLVYGEFLVREERGEVPSLGDYRSRFPQCEAALCRQLEFHDAIANASLTMSGMEQAAGAPITSALYPRVAVSDSPIPDPASTPFSTQSDPAALVRFHNIQRVGQRFSIIRPHARGGLGAVFVALDTELNREVALKQILDQHADDPASRQCFLAEAEITGRLEHPGVVPIYGLGFDASGRPFYAMRLVKGQSLKDAISHFHEGVEGSQTGLGRWVLSLRQLLNRFIAVCNVVQYAHSRGIIHRDLKPSNILLGPFGETLVVDWGLAKAIGCKDVVAGISIPGSNATSPGMPVGTPMFMSPEQAGGWLDQVGPASDVYSLGATLYCLLTGKPPILPSDLLTMLQDVQTAKIISPRLANRRVPAGLEAICVKAMALDPEHRYACPSELARDLECWMADEPVAVFREPISVRLTRWGRRNRTVATGLGALLVSAVAALAIGTILLGWANERAESQRALAEAERSRAELRTKEVGEKAEALERQLYINSVNLAQEKYQHSVGQAEELLDRCSPRLRGWEWDYLKRLCHLDLATIRSHSVGVNCVAYSLDGTKFVSGGGKSYHDPRAEDRAELILWDAATNREIRRFDGLKGSVHSVAFSPDGRMIAAGSGFYQPVSEGRLTLWDASTGKPLFDKKTEHLNVLSVAFSPDGKALAAGLGNYSSTVKGRLTLWEVPTGQRLDDLGMTAQGGVNCVAFSPDGKKIATASAELVELWHRAPLTKARELTGHTNWVYAVAFSPDGHQLATGGWDNTIRLWNTATAVQLAPLEGHVGFVYTLSYSPDGRRLASAGADHTIRLWDAIKCRKDLVLRGHTQGVTSLAFSRDGRRILSASADRTLKLWDATSESELFLRGHKGWVNSVTFSPDGKRLATGSGDRRIILWDALTGKRQLTMEGGKGWVNSVAFSPDGKHLAAAGEYNSVRIWDATSGALDKTFDNLDDYVRCVAFSPDGQLLSACTGAHGASPSPPGIVYVWDMATREQVQCFQRHPGRVFALAFSPDGKFLASGGAPSNDLTKTDNYLLVWEARTGQVMHRLDGYSGAIKSIVFSYNGQRLASGSDDGYVRIWDVKSGMQTHRFQGPAQEVASLAFHPDGTRLASGSYDRTIELLDAATGEKLLTLPGHTAGVVGLSFSPDGRRLASGSVDWTARIWDATKPGQNF